MIVARPISARPVSARGLTARPLGLRTGAAFNPVALPDLLAYYDIRQAGTLFQDTAGTTPVAVATDPIGRWNAVGPSGAPNWTQGTATSRPPYQLTPTRAEFDLLEDSLSVTLTAISGGQIVIVSPAGIWIDSLTFAGGTFTLGPSTYTGGPAGLLSLLSGDVTAVYILDAPLSVDDQAALVAFETARGSAGLITLGAEKISNGDFSAGATGWTATGAGWSFSGGQAIIDGSGGTSSLIYSSSFAIAVGVPHIITCDVQSITAGGISFSLTGTGGTDIVTSSAGVRRTIKQVSATPQRFDVVATNSAIAAVNSVSVREVILP